MDTKTKAFWLPLSDAINTDIMVLARREGIKRNEYIRNVLKRHVDVHLWTLLALRADDD